MADGTGQVQDAAQTPGAAAEKAPDAWSSLGKQLAAGFAALTALFAFAGVTSGRVERLLRNEPELSLLWFVLVGVGIVIGLASPVVPSIVIRWRDALWIVGLSATVSVGLLLAAQLLLTAQEDPSLWERVGGVLVLVVVAAAVTILTAWRLQPRIQERAVSQRAEPRTAVTGPSLRATMIVAGGIVFLAGLFGSFRLAVTSVRVKERPQLVANLVMESDVGAVLDGNVQAAGLRSNEHVHLLVFVRKHNMEPERAYESRTGPDQEGMAAHSFKLPMSTAGIAEIHVASLIAEATGAAPGTCDSLTRTAACVTIPVPAAASRPVVDLAWSVGDAGIIASITTRMVDVGAAESVRVLVWRLGDMTYLHRSSGVAGAFGLYETSVDVPAGPPDGRLCILAVAEGSDEEATTMPPPAECPVSAGHATAQEVVVPSLATSTTTAMDRP